LLYLESEIDFSYFIKYSPQGKMFQLKVVDLIIPIVYVMYNQ